MSRTETEAAALAASIDEAEARWLQIPAFLRSRCLLVNRHHSAYRFHLAAAVEDLPLAAFSLVQALLHEEDAEGERSWGKLFYVAAE